LAAYFRNWDFPVPGIDEAKTNLWFS
jgi:hypothetical protein